MAHINDLDPQVLYRILCLASGEPAKGIDTWKHKLTLLQVCTKWYDLFKSYVFSQGFVNIYPMNYKVLQKINRSSCVYYADNVFVCRSNLGIITGRDECNCDCVSKLNVIIDIDINTSQYFHVLTELLTLGVGYWLNLSTLSFNGSSIFDYSSESEDMDPGEISATVSSYIHVFKNRLPNITHLDVSLQEDDNLRTTLYILTIHYAPRLQLLNLNYLAKFPLPQFSTELTSLSLSLSNYGHCHLSFYAKSLQFLMFYDIYCSNFSWWIFHDFTTPGRIEFTNLKTLDLIYENQTDEEKKLSEKYAKQARPYGSHMLRFPKLECLLLYDPPVDCDVFYTDTIPTCLKELNIRGSCDSVVAASRLRFTSVNEMYIDVYGEETLTNAFYIAADRYFGYTKIGSTCTVDFSLLVDIQRTASWINITDLRLGHIEFTNLLKLVPNLYNLRDLRVWNISLSDESLSIIRLGLEEEEQGEFELLDTRLERIFIGNTEPDNPYNLLAILNHLLLRTTTLRSVKVKGKLYSFAEKSFLPEKFPHVDFS